MPFLLKSNIGTRKDPTRRGGKKHFLIRKGRLCIGAKQLGPACSMIVSDATYEKHKKVIETFIGLGALEAKVLVGSLDGDALLAATGAAPAEPGPAPSESAAAPEEKAGDAPAGEDADDSSEDGSSSDAEAAPKRRGRKKASAE